MEDDFESPLQLIGKAPDTAAPSHEGDDRMSTVTSMAELQVCFIEGFGCLL